MFESRKQAMTTVPTAAVPPHLNAPRPAAQAGTLATPVASIDPIKLLTKYRWVLVGATVGGLLFGLLMHLLLLKVYPVWRAQAIFQCFQGQASIGRPLGSDPIDDVALDRFMQTQSRLMTSSVVLQRVSEDTRLREEAPVWSGQFVKNGVFNSAEAFLELQDKLSARVIPQTSFIEMGMSYQNPKDVTAIVRLCKENYMATIKKQVGDANRAQIDALGKSIASMESSQRDLQTRRERLMLDNRVDTLNRQVPEATQTLQGVNNELTRLGMEKKNYGTQRDQMEEDLKNPGGVKYSDSIRDDVEKDPLVAGVRQTVNSMESEKRSLLQRYTTEHRQVKEIDTALKGYQQNLVVMREKLLQQSFDAQLDRLRKFMNQLDAQEAELSSKREDLTKRLTELTRIQSSIEDLDSQVKQLIDTRNRTDADYRSLIALETLQTNQRVAIAVDERTPDELSFPKLQVMLPAGLILVVAGVVGSLVLREIVDQRIKSPADVNLIPKARVLGMVPDAEEDPAGVSNVAMAFRDKDRGVMAECFRQIRATIIKRTHQMGHKTILVVGGTPGAGATTVISNLAYALAAADRRVLVIDANTRRPGQHKAFGMNEAPGLADVLAGTHTLSGVVQRTADKKVDVVTAGSREKRDLERLSTELMTSILRDAKDAYDIVLVDTAPMVVSGDAMGLAARCDASILVVRAMHEKRGMVARLRNDLADVRAEHLGILVNGVKSAAGGYMKSNMKATHEYQTQGH